MREYGSKFGITGKIVEQEVFGNPAEFMKKKRKIDMGHDQYLPFREAMHDVKTIQDNPENGIDPTDPEKEFANDLHASIAQELTPDDYTMLRFYTAVETVLDHFHGVDGFFEFDLEDDRTAIVTMDVTTNPNKLVYKADVILHIPSDGIDRKIDPEEYDLVLKKTVREVMPVIKSKIKQRRAYAA